MTNNDLKRKWVNLSENNANIGFRSLRISADCICELYIGISQDAKRSLILALPENKKLTFKVVQKENLTIEYFREKNFIVLELSNNDFVELFDDLILSLYLGIKNITLVDEYANYFIQTFYKWSEFFQDKKSNLLSEEEIKGLFGELLVLKLMIEKLGMSEVDSLLNGWKGPYDKGSDFELENKNVEVKTKSQEGIDINISSEFQLEVPLGKLLELYVVSLRKDLTLGIHLRDLILQVKILVQKLSGDNSILWKALSQKNITTKNMSQYDMYKFQPVNWVSYNCSDKTFPKLSRSNIPEEISSLKYSLRTNLLTSFIIEQSNF